MIRNLLRILISVKAKLFFGFLAMTLIITLLGAEAFFSLSSAGQSVKKTFDRPLMAVNFARSSSQVFSELQIEEFRQTEAWTVYDPDLLAVGVSKFRGDLAVAKERSIAPQAESFFKQVDIDLARWEALAALPLSPGTQEDKRLIAQDIASNLDIIVELQTNQSYREREATLSQISKFSTYLLWSIGIAVALTLLLSAWVALTIINPLKTAAVAARKISAGDFTAKIPKGGDDETGALLKTMAVMQANISQRMGREKSLRALAQDRLADSLKNSQDAILLTDENDRIIVCNPQTQTLFSALCGLNLINTRYLDHFSRDGVPLVGGETFDGARQEIALSDGRWVRVSASKTQEAGRLFIWTDITDSKIRAQRLREAKDAAEDADKAKSMFLAAMSHELRTPLNAVIGFSDIIKSEQLRQGGNENHAKLADLISQSGAHLLGIVKDVLSMADGRDATEMTVEFSPVDMVDIIEFTCAATLMDIGQKHIKLIQHIPDTPLQVRGDTPRLQQALFHLLSNAIKFGREGGVIKVTAQMTDKGEVRVDVIDNGIGISPENLNTIFEPFSQVESGYTRTYDGTGLGLSLARKIIDLHGGKLRIQSKLGKGTAVSLYLTALTASQSNAHIIES
ncbi:sensor histidine kinase [Robiginitomaculum antarcticum]|uniref:sensor histidine kinase n=1 Tax=Robiginitomaculum antarcticum TaxID=437507 RepID=UPI0003A1AA63|nr:HAMP domain-containing histidine kinase [Robiginitomaculum antarcticum]